LPLAVAARAVAPTSQAIKADLAGKFMPFPRLRVFFKEYRNAPWLQFANLP
jgi:hypothetical protein